MAHGTKEQQSALNAMNAADEKMHTASEAMKTGNADGKAQAEKMFKEAEAQKKAALQALKEANAKA